MASTKARYQGTDGAHLYGVPARDLSDTEYAALTGDQREGVLTAKAGGRLLYRVTGREEELVAVGLSDAPAPEQPAPVSDKSGEKPAAKEKAREPGDARPA